MHFEDVKVIWNSQDEAPLYAVNEEVLHSMLKSKRHGFGRLVFWQQWQSYGSSLFVIAAISAILIAHVTGNLGKLGFPVALSIWDVCALLLAGSFWAFFALSIYAGKKRQEQREREFTSTLLGDLDRDIDQAEYQIRCREHVRRGFLPPCLGVILIQLVGFRMAGLSEWFVLPVIAVMVFLLIWESRMQQRLVDQKVLPRLRELESLRVKLTEPDD